LADTETFGISVPLPSHVFKGICGFLRFPGAVFGSFEGNFFFATGQKYTDEIWLWVQVLGNIDLANQFKATINVQGPDGNFEKNNCKILPIDIGIRAGFDKRYGMQVDLSAFEQMKGVSNCLTEDDDIFEIFFKVQRA
jgi:hypothetical protein